MDYDMHVATTPVSTAQRLEFPSCPKDDSGYFTPSPLSGAQIGSESASTRKDSTSDHTPVISKCLPSAFSTNGSIIGFTKLKSAPAFASVSVFRRPYPKTQPFDRLRNNLTEMLKWEHRESTYQSRFVITHPIGELVGVTKVDFLKKLGDLHLSSIVSAILRSVDDRDLCAVSCVSKRWREVCSEDLAARERKEQYIEIHTRQKENDLDELSTVPKMHTTKRTSSVLDDIQNVFASGSGDTENVEEKESVKTELKHYNQFVEVGQCLRPNETLDKCPRCGSPAKVNGPQKRARCSSSGCEFDYCTLCRCEYNVRHHCSPVRPGSRRLSYPNRKNAKRNLRRLLS